jgi:polyhydroxybutyrate depolymerase
MARMIVQLGSPMRPLAPLVLVLALCGCWQVPELPVPVQPSAAELLASRAHLLREPPGAPPGPADGGQTWPLLVVLHAYGNRPVDTQAFLGLDAPEVLERYFVSLPQGLPENGGLGWNPVGTPAPPWDSAFVRAVIDDLLATRAIDPRRVFVVGHSQGAHMAYRVACDDGARVAAVAGVAGQLLECAPSRPVSVLALHGTNDAVIRYLPSGSEPGALDTIRTWGRADGCSGSLAPTGAPLDLTIEVDAETSLQAFTGCPQGVDVELATMALVPHRPVWTPGFVPFLLGFLEAHARP